MAMGQHTPPYTRNEGVGSANRNHTSWQLKFLLDVNVDFMKELDKLRDEILDKSMEFMKLQAKVMKDRSAGAILFGGDTATEMEITVQIDLKKGIERQWEKDREE